MSDNGPAPELVVEKIDLSFRVLDDMERFLGECSPTFSTRWCSKKKESVLAVFSDESHRLLAELMRFRHFKRYYPELDYDWEKLRCLLSVYRRCLLTTRRFLLR